MPSDKHAVIIVYSTSHALRIEKLLKRVTIRCKLIPVPRQISSNCGVCVRVLQSDSKAALGAIEAAGVPIEGLHDI